MSVIATVDVEQVANLILRQAYVAEYETNGVNTFNTYYHRISDYMPTGLGFVNNRNIFRILHDMDETHDIRLTGDGRFELLGDGAHWARHLNDQGEYVG